MTAANISVHDLGGVGPTVLYSHATGFHGRCWQPVADLLGGFHNVAYDARGHGDTPAPPDWHVQWEVYGQDAAAIATTLGDDGAIIGVGHSMGGAALLMAAIAQPDLFRALVVYEPIVTPTSRAATPNQPENFLANGARRRRSSFDSYEAAIANYSAKPPMNLFTPSALEAYVRGGFALADDGQVHLKCRPEHEARTYEAGGAHLTWDHLSEVTVPTWVLCGRPEPMQPSMWMRVVAEQIPESAYVQYDDVGHFGPMQQPETIAAAIGRAAAFVGL